MQEVEISTKLVSNLLATQFPQYSKLELRPISPGGHDNRTFRLGQEMLVRLPSAERYKQQVIVEQNWLPLLSRYLSTNIPTPPHIGHECDIYPWKWSIYSWLPGNSLQQVSLTLAESTRLAQNLAEFIVELHRAPTQNAPLGGPHNFYRACHPSIYDQETRYYIKTLQNIIDAKQTLQLWEEAINSKWACAPVWVHGDLSAGNILLLNNKLSAVIDFGCMSIGDPACDLTPYWTMFEGQARQVFADTLCMDNDTWARSRAWVLWKTLFLLSQTNTPFEGQNKQLLTELVGYYS